MQYVSDLPIYDQPLTPRLLKVDERIYRNYPTFQRNLRWTQKRQQLLIDSILRNYPIGSLLAVSDGAKFEIFDGKQRIETLCAFMSDGFPTASALPDRIKPIAPRRLYSELPQEVQDQFNRYRLRMQVWRKEDIGEHASLVFRRLNDGGIPLTRSEILYSFESEANARADELSQHPWIVVHTTAAQRERRIEHLYTLLTMMMHRPILQAMDSPAIRVYARGDRARGDNDVAAHAQQAKLTLNALKPAIRGKHIARIPELVVAVQAAQRIQGWSMHVPSDLWQWVDRAIAAYDAEEMPKAFAANPARHRARPSDELDRPTPSQRFWLMQAPSLLEFVTKP